MKFFPMFSSRNSLVLSLTFTSLSTFRLAVWSHKSDCTSRWMTFDGKALEWPRNKPRDAIWDVRDLGDLHTGSPGTASWTRLHTAVEDREGTAYTGWGDRDYMCAIGSGGSGKEYYVLCKEGPLLCDQDPKEHHLVRGVYPPTTCSHT